MKQYIVTEVRTEGKKYLQLSVHNIGIDDLYTNIKEELDLVRVPLQYGAKAGKVTAISMKLFIDNKYSLLKNISFRGLDVKSVVNIVYKIAQRTNL